MAEPVCSRDECDREAFKRGLCWKHFMGVGEKREEPSVITRHGSWRSGDLPLTTILKENAKAQPIPEAQELGRYGGH